MSPPKHELVIEDCDTALNLDHNYVKALNRRAGALEGLKRYEEALRGTSDDQCVRVPLSMDVPVDFTAATILDKFKNEGAGQAVERVLKKLSNEKAAEILAVSGRAIIFIKFSIEFTRTDSRKPSPFVHIYLRLLRGLPITSAQNAVDQVKGGSYSSFTGPLPTQPESPSTGDNTLILALEALAAADYAHSLTLVNEALEQGVSWDVGKAEALNLRGTFKYVPILIVNYYSSDHCMTGS
jgi:import receptor subunit TOM70